MVERLQVEWADGRTVRVTASLPDRVSGAELRIESRRNERISKFSDRSAEDPQHGPGREKRRGREDKEIWFPVIDVELVPNLVAVAAFDGVSAGDTYAWNGHLAPEMHPLERQVVVREDLEHWENGLYVESSSATLQRFYLRRVLTQSETACEGAVEILVRCLTSDWSGKISLYGIEDGEEDLLAAAEVKPRSQARAETWVPDLSRHELMRALAATVRYILRCRHRNPLSLTFGGLFLFYDLDAATYRRPDWVWTWGPAIKLLLDGAKVPDLQWAVGADRMLRAAREAGEASLRFQCLDQEHPAYGLVFCRYDPRPDFPHGYAGLLSPADSLFLAGWGWIPLYEETGDRRYLDAAILLVEQMTRILSLDDVVEQDYIIGIERWKNWTMDESGFGMEGFAELFRLTGDEGHLATARAFIENLLTTLLRPDGLWDKVWHRNDPDRENMGWTVDAPAGTPVRVPTDRMTRGQGWAMMGLLAAHRMMPEGRYLDLAEQMSTHLVEAQQTEGYWTFRFDEPADRVGISEKGTTLWSLLCYRLYEQTGDERYLAPARKALRWAIDAQYAGDDSNAQGGIVGRSPASGVVYRRWFPLICTYTMAWHGLAILEELKLQQR